MSQNKRNTNKQMFQTQCPEQFNDGIKFATSTTCKTTMSQNKRNTNKQMFQTPCPEQFNVGMRVKESVLRSLRVSSTLTLRPLDATQH